MTRLSSLSRGRRLWEGEVRGSLVIYLSSFPKQGGLDKRVKKTSGLNQGIICCF